MQYGPAGACEQKPTVLHVGSANPGQDAYPGALHRAHKVIILLVFNETLRQHISQGLASSQEGSAERGLATCRVAAPLN